MCFTKQNEEDGLPGFGGNWHQRSQTGTVGRYLTLPYLQLHSTHCQPRELWGILSDSIWLLHLQSGPLDAVLFPVTALKDHWSSVENPKKKTDPHRAFRCSVWQEEEFSKLGNHPWKHFKFSKAESIIGLYGPVDMCTTTVDHLARDSTLKKATNLLKEIKDPLGYKP
jgi:hypothetical protein